MKVSIRRGLMVATVLALAIAILVTPSLVGRRQEISAIPRLLVDFVNDRIFLDVQSALQDFRYNEIALVVTALDVNYSNTIKEDDTYDVHMAIPANVTRYFAVNVTLRDDQALPFEWNGTFSLSSDDGGPYLSVLAEDQQEPKIYRSFPFKVTIPRRSAG